MEVFRQRFDCVPADLLGRSLLLVQEPLAELHGELLEDAEGLLLVCVLLLTRTLLGSLVDLLPPTDVAKRANPAISKTAPPNSPRRNRPP